jgi:Methylase of chemotaxis methyl-accepting proteins
MYTVRESEVDELIAFIKSNYGIDLSNKRVFVEQRALRAMARHGYDCFSDCFNFICADATGALLAELISGLTVNFTMFCREPSHFDFLKNTALPQLYKKENADKVLRLWSAGCATGEEPYTLAMIMADFFNIQRPQWDTKILATDISTTALDRAAQAVYALDSISNLPANWTKHFFIPVPDDPEWVQVAPQIRDEVVFRKHNLAAAPFEFKKKFHIIFCRNVMMYFDENGRKQLVNRFYDVLEDGGYLFISTTEMIEKEASPFTYVQPAVYQKRVEI